MEKEQVKIKPLTKDFVMPKKVSGGSAAYDIGLSRDTYISYGRQIIKTGFALALPPNIALDIRSRSGYTAKGLIVYDDYEEEFRIDADVQLGLLDEDYRGEVGVILNVREEMAQTVRYHLKKGQAIAQMKFCYVPQTELVVTETIDETERGDKGFGEMDNE